MSGSTSVVDHISDTARWVATYRALESERSDALFRDPFAARLAGEQGRRIVERLPLGKLMGWTVVVRTQVIDELLLRAIRDEGCDAVLNLAAGLDTRPYRLDLPASLRWVEVDLPAILSYKEEKLRAERPCCDFERVALDLFDREARKRLFRRVAQGRRKVFVLTEGFLMYLEPEQVAGLSEDFLAEDTMRWWLQDYVAQPVLRACRSLWQGVLGRGNSEFKFFTPEGRRFFTSRGWKTREYRPLLWDAKRLERDMPFGWLARAGGALVPGNLARLSGGMLLLERASRS